MFTVYPQTKIYFAHWPEVTYGSASVKSHGKKVLAAIGLAVSKIDDLTSGLQDLSEQHAYKLRVDPTNFKVRLWLTPRRTIPPARFYAQKKGGFDLDEATLFQQKQLCAIHRSCPNAFSW